MKVLMTTDTVGGVWTYAVELSRALTRAGAAVVLAAKGRMDPGQRADAEAAGVRLVEREVLLEWMLPDPWADVAAAGDWLLALEAEHAPDVVHLNDYAHAALPFRAPVLVVAHSCVLSWYEAVRGCAAPAEWNRYRRAVSAGLRGADAVVAPSSAMLSALRRHWESLPSSRVIPNGRRAELFPPADKEALVFCAGRLWDEAKNAASVARIATRLSWPVYLAGDATGFEAPAGVTLLGRLPATEIAAWMGRAWIYALPARYEPFGLSALEAALAGCALVLGDIESLREVWEDAAVFVPPGDPEALQSALDELITRADRRADLAARGRRRALQLTPERMAAAYLETFATLIAAGRRSPAPMGAPSCAS